MGFKPTGFAEFDSPAAAARRRVKFRVWRRWHALCMHPTGVRWFVRCRCGRHAVWHVSTNVGRPKVMRRWFCERHYAEFRASEDA